MVLTFPPAYLVSAVRALMNENASYNDWRMYDIDVYVGGEWVHLCETGNITQGAATWYQCNLGTPAVVAQARIRTECIATSGTVFMDLYEFQFYGELGHVDINDVGVGSEELFVPPFVNDEGVGVDTLTVDWVFVADSGEGEDFLLGQIAVTVIVIVFDQKIAACIFVTGYVADVIPRVAALGNPGRAIIG